MVLWKLWIITGVALFILEIFVPGFFSACIGVAFFVTAVAAFFEMNIKEQLIIFSIANLIMFVGLRPFFMKYLSPDKLDAKTNMDALIGREGVVSEAIDVGNIHGRVKVGGEDWRAITIDGKAVAVGQKVVVLKVDGTKLLVK